MLISCLKHCKGYREVAWVELQQHAPNLQPLIKSAGANLDTIWM